MCSDAADADIRAVAADAEESVTKLDHIGMIEDPAHVGKLVEVEAVIASNSVTYSVPKCVRVEGHLKGSKFSREEQVISYRPHSPVLLQFVGVSEARVKNVISWSAKSMVFGNDFVLDNYEVLEYWSVYFIRVRPKVMSLERVDDRIIDERGFEYKPYDVYVVSDRKLSFQPSTIMRFTGRVVPNPKTQTVTLLAYDVREAETSSDFDREALERLRRKFSDLGVAGTVDWYLTNFENWSGIVGRRNLAFASFLAFFSPLWIRFTGKVERGWGIISVVGDTTTGKSETVRKMIKLLRGGTIITAETASAVGLVGTATQVERHGWFIDWGFLVLNDGKLLAIDGSHKLGKSQWSALAESERYGIVRITKAAKGEAPAKTRLIKIANPINPENRTTADLTHFLYPAQALATIYNKETIARLDLAAFSDRRDVPIENINVKDLGDPDPDIQLLKELLKWVWVGNPQVLYEDEAIDEILTAATHLYHRFHSDEVPLVTADMKYKLARLSAALAAMTLSTNDDYTQVIVKKEHVQEVVNFIENEYVKAGLHNIAAREKYENDVSDEEAQEIIDEIAQIVEDEEKAERIIEWIVFKSRFTKEELRTEFELADKNELRPLISLLRNYGLIDQGRGFYPTKRAIQLYKKILPRLPSLPSSDENPPPRSVSSSSESKNLHSDKDESFGNKGINLKDNHLDMSNFNKENAPFIDFYSVYMSGKKNFSGNIGGVVSSGGIFFEEGKRGKRGKAGSVTDFIRIVIRERGQVRDIELMNAALDAGFRIEEFWEGLREVVGKGPYREVVTSRGSIYYYEETAGKS